MNDPFVIKSVLSAESMAAAGPGAIIVTVVQMREMNDVDPHAWIAQSFGSDRAGLADVSDRGALIP
ncbi:hypothetical protein ACFIOY_18620 [Bradyrhizobium sp. TZ2]